MRFINKYLWKPYVRAMQNYMFWIGFNVALLLWLIKEFAEGNISGFYAVMVGVGLIFFIGVDQQLHHQEKEEDI